MNEGGSDKRRPRVLLGVSGSVAAIKVPELVKELVKFAEVKCQYAMTLNVLVTSLKHYHDWARFPSFVLATKPARHFFKERDLPWEAWPLLGDEEEWRMWEKKGDPVLHIDLRRWADVLVIVPLSANTMAKMAHGLCDNMLTCVVRAWNFSKPLLVAPAMNTYMWESVFTVRQLEELKNLGVQVIPPVKKVLACGDVGDGAMAAPVDIVNECSCVLRNEGFDI